MKNKPCVGEIWNNPKCKKEKKVEGSQMAGAVDAASESAAHDDRMNRMHGKQGHGFAAEQANDLIDTMHGRDAMIIGDDNEEKKVLRSNPDNNRGI